MLIYLHNSRNSETVFSRRNEELVHSSKSTIRQSRSDSTLTILLDVSLVVASISFILFAFVLRINCSKCSRRVIGETLNVKQMILESIWILLHLDSYLILKNNLADRILIFRHPYLLCRCLEFSKSRKSKVTQFADNDFSSFLFLDHFFFLLRIFTSDFLRQRALFQSEFL